MFRRPLIGGSTSPQHQPRDEGAQHVALFLVGAQVEHRWSIGAFSSGARRSPTLRHRPCAKPQLVAQAARSGRIVVDVLLHRRRGGADTQYQVPWRAAAACTCSLFTAQV